MFQLGIIWIFKLLLLFEYFWLGVLGDKGLILGVWNPASFATITDIPKDSVNPFRNVSLKINPSGSQITSLSADTKKAVVFAAIGETIYIYHNFSIWQNVSAKFSVQFRGKSAAIGQIAFDFVSNNLYWCDSLLNWIAMKPAYNYNNTFYKVIVQQDLNQPEGLALDPVNRFMFFSDNDPNSRIEKASLDGRDRVVIVHRGLSRVLALTVDLDNKKLYWADYGRQTLEGCDYDGANRRVIRRTNQISMTSLAYHQNMLVAVSVGSKSMLAVDISSGSLLYSRTFLSAKPYAITVYDNESIRSFSNPCRTFNCEHICLNARSGPKCLCYEGFIFDSNNISCIEKSWFFERGFIVSNASMFAMHEVHSASSQSNRYNYMQIPNNIIETFAVDAISDIIYFVDSSSGSLKKHDIISQKTSTIASVSSARDLTFDWIAKLLGWMEPTTSSIRSFSVNSQTSATIYTNQYQSASLTIDPHNGALFWITGLSDRSIVRGSWTRITPTVLISAANLNNPRSLQYDVTSHRLYWLDRTLIKSSMANGSDMKSHIITNGATKAFVYKDFFGWINGDKLFFGRKTDTSSKYVAYTLNNLKDVAVFDSSLEKDVRGTCKILNGECGELCVPEKNGRRCECDIGLQLQPDQSCDSDVLTANFIIASDYTHGRIIQVNLQTGTVVKLPLSINKPNGIVFDKTTRTLFFSDSSRNTIMTTSLHGTNKTLLYTTGFAYADRLTIDYSTGNLYYTAVGPTTSQSYIGVVHRATSLHKTLISDLHSPRDITLHPSKGYLFWTEFGNITEIGRTNMDGTSKIYIATTQIVWPNGLTIDFTSSRLYWTDGKKNRIESSDLNGGNRQILASDNDAHLMSIVSHGQYLYYTAWNRQRITKLDKRTGSKVIFMSNHPELGRLDGLDIYADESQDVSSSCSSKNGFCSTFCFPTPTGRTCGCQDNVNLQSDQLTCQGVSRCPTLLRNLHFLDCQPYPGQSCNFECKTGYRLAINTSVSCGSLGQWNLPIDTLCEVIMCPESLDTAVLSPKCSRRIGDSCSFSCINGYRLTTSTNLMCTADGTWNRDTNTLCSLIMCPESLNTAVLSPYCSRRIGDSCSFSCTNGYRPTTSTNLVCTADGTWNRDTNTMCSLIMCPESLDTAMLSPNCSRRIGDSCSFSCTNGYRPTTSTNLVCTADGTWNRDTNTLCSLIMCPESLDIAVLSPYCSRRIGDSCSFSCTNGYRPTTSINLVCTADGIWNRDTNTLCSLIMCPESQDTAVLSPNCSRRIGDSCSFSCTNGYRPTTSTNLVCTADGTWNRNTNTMCSLIMCPESLDTAVLSPNCSRRIGDSCSFSCTNGYRPTTSTNLVCTADGTWNRDTNTLCSLIMCPKSLDTAVLSPYCSRRIGDSCSFSCTNGYRPTTSTNLVCTADGTWNRDTNTLCSLIMCPESLDTAVLSPNCSRRIGDSCSFSCTNVYRPTTSTNLVCTADGTWNRNTNTMCSLIMCPESLDTAVLSPKCSRRIGDSCSFSCINGYRPTTSTNLVCTADGTWNRNTNTMCSLIMCPESLDTAVLSPNCSRRIGDSCSFSCTNGYRPTTSTNLVCTADGTWNRDTNTLCSLIMCPESLNTAVLSSKCSRRIGDSCSFSCTNGYRPTTSTKLVCTADGTWNRDTNTLCSLIMCPESLDTAVLSPNCSRRIGDSCSFSCTNGYRPTTSTNLVCTADGTWNRDTNTLCSQGNPTPEKHKMDINYLYLGLASAGAVVVVLVIVGIICLLKKGNNMHRGRYKRASSNTQHNALLTFENRGFQRAGDEYVTINSVYDAGNVEYDEPNIGH
nr:low-density lipoprotein receptor-related protein 2 isoform X3 [Crassostrea gigas]